MEIGSGAFGELYATTCKARGSLCAKNFVQALEVSARRLVVNRSNIGSCTALEEVSLRRYLPNKLLSGLKKLVTAPFRRLMKPKKKAAKKPALALPKEPAPKPEADNELVSAILDILREKGYTVSRVQEAEPASELEKQLYAIARLEQAKRTILLAKEEMPAARKKIEKQLQKDPNGAKDWYQTLRAY